MVVAGGYDTTARAWAQQFRCCDADGAVARDRGTPWQVRTDGSETPLVGMVRCLYRRASERQDAGRGRPGGEAPNRGRTSCMKHFDAVSLGRAGLVPGGADHKAILA